MQWLHKETFLSAAPFIVPIMSRDSYGAFPRASGGVDFRVWAPDASKVELILFQESEVSIAIKKLR